MKLPAIPERPKIVISVLFYYCEELAADFLAHLAPQLARASRDLNASVVLEITLNYPASVSFWENLIASHRHALPALVSVELSQPGFNAGFGLGHNRSFTRCGSDIFVVMNSDLFCESEDWILQGVKAMRLEGAAVLGARENASWLREDGCGIQIVDDSRPLDFVDASILFVRSVCAHQMGLFSDDFQFFYFEDSDLCLRYRQAGLIVSAIPIPHRHLRSSSSRKIPRYLISGVLEENRHRFFRKWGIYLQTKRLANRVLLDLHVATKAEFLASLPVILALRREHPIAEIAVIPPKGGDLSLHKTIGCRILEDSADVPFDRIITWSPDLVGKPEPPAVTLARAGGVSLDWKRLIRELRVCVRTSSPPSTAVGPTRAVIELCESPEKFDGRTPPPEVLSSLAARLVSLGFQVEGLGPAQLTQSLERFAADHPVREIPDDALSKAGCILDAAVLVTADSDLLLIAQMLGVRAFALFGATSALRRLFAWEKTGVFYAPSLSCLGCNHRFGFAHRNFCIRRDQACMSPALGTLAADCLERFLRDGSSDIQQAVQIEQSISLRPKLQSAELDLSSWPAE